MSKAITTLLSDKSDEILKPDTPTMIKVDHVSMDFNIANQQLNSLKEYFIALARRQLMFKRFRALNDVSLEVQKGDVYGILGTNGSGKSTLLKIVSGVLEPSSGSVTICGNIAPLIEMGAGFDHELTARENIYLNGALLGYSRKFIDQHFDEIVDFSEVGEFLDMPLKNYSSGMISRIAFAIATVIVPEILIVDEVLAVGDFMFRQKCEKRIQSLIRDHGTTVLIVSHSSPQIERLCNKAIWIEKGHTRMVGTAKEVSQTYQALGGHAGSAEAEQFVFELVNDQIAPETKLVKRITGQDRYAIDASLKSDLSYDSPIEYVVMACGDDLGAQIVALNLASALGGTTLITKKDALPDSTAANLAHLAPRYLVVIDHGNVADTVVESAKKILPQDTEIAKISNFDLEKLSESAYEYAEAAGASWGDIVVLSENRSGGAAASLAPFLAEKPQPFFICSSASSAEKALLFIEDRQPKEIVILGSPIPFDEAFYEKLSETASSVTRLTEESTEKGSARALEWVMGARNIQKLDSIYLTPHDEKTNAISAAPLAAEMNAAVVIVNHNDLDSMQRGADFIIKHGADIGSLKVIGLDTSFNGTDVSIFSKALARAKRKNSE